MEGCYVQEVSRECGWLGRLLVGLRSPGWWDPMQGDAGRGGKGTLLGGANAFTWTGPRLNSRARRGVK